MSKNELVAKAIELGSKLSKTDLLKLNNAALEGIVSDLEDRKQKDDEFKQMKEMVAQLLSQQDHKKEDLVEEEVNENKDIVSQLFAKSAVHANSSALAKRQKMSEIPNDRLVSVMSGVAGTLFWRSPVSQIEYEFLEYGAVEEMPFSDVKAMRNRSPKLVRENLVIILDPDIVDVFNLRKQYENLLLPESIEEIIKDYHRLVDYFKSATEATKTILIRYAINMYHEKKLVDLNSVRFLEEKFNFSFEDTIMVDRDEDVVEIS